MKKVLLNIFAILFTLPAMAAMNISGTILDENDEPLTGATIVASGTTIGTTADMDGNFNIPNFPDDAQVEISFVGYKKQTFSAKSNLGTIKMIPENHQLNEVEVTAAAPKNLPCFTQTEFDEYIKANNIEQNGQAYTNLKLRLLPNGASRGTFDFSTKICTIQGCQPEYKLNKDKKTCDKIVCDAPRYIMNADKTGCDDQNGKNCKSGDANAKTAKYKWNEQSSTLNCVITKCNDKYLPNDAGTACERSEGDCTPEQIAKIEHATKGQLKKGVCHATECDAGYEPDDGKCVVISGNCNPMPENATSANRQFIDGAEVCIIESCKDGYNVSDDKKSCVEIPKPKLSEADSQKKIEELRDNAQQMKDKEQSTANKLLGATGIASVGIGGMQVASALAEQNADADAERDMAAYLATFRCDYGGGVQVRGGDKNIELPGANQLLPYYTEYTQLASDLKIAKQALGMPAGIESEIILDKANTGLYDDVGIGKTDGAYTSLSRALTDTASADAAEWAAQKSDSAQKLKTGAIVAGAGAVASLAGNLAINSGKSKREQSDDINNRYESLKKLESDISNLPDKTKNQKCPDDASGAYHPDCICKDKKSIYNTNSNTCDKCLGDKVVKDNQCVCPDGTVPSENNKCVKTSATPKCNKDGANVSINPTTGECTCLNGYVFTDDKQNCECPSETHVIADNGKCTSKPIVPTKPNILSNITTTPPVIPVLQNQDITQQNQQETIFEFTLPTDNLFALNSSTLSSDAQSTLRTGIQNLTAEMAANKVSADEICITITGKTDKSGGDAINLPLSKKRADAVKSFIASTTPSIITSDNAVTYGVGSQGCEKLYDKNCRAVHIVATSGKCKV